MLFCFTSLLLVGTIGLSAKEIFVVTTTEDLADLVKEVGGDKVKVVSLSYGYQDPHLVEPRPSMVVQLKKADMLVKIGMDLDIWVDSLIQAARNTNIIYGAKGYVDASVGILRLEVPGGKIDASMGDIHIYGNPHYWLDPENAKPITKNILDGLCKISPENTEYFKNNRDSYLEKLDKMLKIWDEKMKFYKGAKIITYHKTWSYFANHFNLEVIATVEPKPGIPPSPAHLNSLIIKMKKEKPVMILHEIFYPKKTSEMVSKETQVKLVILPTSVGGVKEVKDYISLFDYIIDKIIKGGE
jgi:ABC-type Zn uptake system ZnuABC Zn-binding protein ZnuA